MHDIPTSICSQTTHLDLKESYRAHWKKYIKSAKRSSVPAGEDPALVASRLNIEKEYCSAIKKVDQKIDMASKLYELVRGRHLDGVS